MTTTDLVARLREAIDEIEQRTRLIQKYNTSPLADELAGHTLCHCAGARQIINLHPRCDVHDEPRHHCDVCITCGDGSIWPCPTLLALAAGYGIT